MAGETDVELAVRWSEAGTPVPNRVRQELRDIGNEAAPATDRLQRFGQAMERMERREPTMILRQLRGEVAMLGSEALGATGPIGRLATHLAMFSVGGAMGLAVVGGFVAIAFEIKKIVEFSDQLDKNLLKLNTTIAAGTRAAPWMAIAGGQQRMTELRDPGFFRTIGNTFMDLLTGGSATTSGAAIGRQAELGGLETQEAIQRARIHSEARRAELERTKAVEESVLALDKARLGLHPTNAQIEALAERSDALKLSTARLTDEQKRAIEINERLTRAQDLLNKAHEWMLNQPLSRGTGNFTQAGVGFIGPGATYGVAAQIDWMGRPIEEDRSGFTDLGRIGVMGAGGGRIGEVGKGIGKEVADQIAPLVGAFMHLAGATVSGGPGAAVGALGGVASSLAGVKSLSAAAGPLGIAGAVLGGLGGLIGLFGHHAPVVTIGAYMQQALDQLRTVRADPLTTQFIVVGGGDMRTIQYQLGRLQRRDAVTRMP